jgi:ankyrin repeat protein
MDQPHPGELDPDPRELWEAARDGDVQHCRELIHTNGFNPEYVEHEDDHQGTTALIVALIWSGLYTKVKKVNCVNCDHLAVVKLLLYYGADASRICNNGTNALHNAIIHAPSKEYLFLILSKLGRNQLDVKDLYGRTALMCAILFTDPALYKNYVTALLRHGADAHTVDNKENSILHQSASPSQWLLDTVKPYHVDINRRCGYGRTPIQFQIFQRRRGRESECFARVIALLLANNVDISIVDDDGKTAVENAESFFPEDDKGLLLLQYRETERARMLAFAMGTHPRNNPNCLLGGLSPEYMQMIADASGFDRTRPFSKHDKEF